MNKCFLSRRFLGLILKYLTLFKFSVDGLEIIKIVKRNSFSDFNHYKSCILHYF